MRVFRLFLLWAVLLGSVRGADFTVETGELDGAKFTLAKPREWNRQLLLLAHGYRPEAAPLVADLQPIRGRDQILLNEGWMIAKTSYRRNGVIIADAIADLDRLRAEVERRHGKPTRVLVEGDSMGGLIAMLIAERIPEDEPQYHGVIAIGPAMSLRDPNATGIGLSMQPQLPLVFLCNRNELEAARQYTELRLPGQVRPNVPLLLRVNRDGHINVNQAERLVAFRAVNAWLEYGRDTLPRPSPGVAYVDVTQVPEPLPSRVFLNEDQRGFTAHVTEVSAVFGNLQLDVQAADFAAIGLVQNAYFELTLRDKTVRVLYGKDFASVKRGEWVVFENADGFFWLGRNGLSAAEATSAQVGDLVHVRRFAPTPTNTTPR